VKADSQWKDFTLEAGDEMTHRKQAISTGVPHPYIRFEAFSTFNGGAGEKHKLDIGWDKNPQKILL
jgi:hypothetical protein